MKNIGGRKINNLKLFEYILQNVSKPQQYIGNEYGVFKKNLTENDIKKYLKFLLVFPDIYEIGMSNFAIKILFEIINSIDDIICDRAFIPDDDFVNLLYNLNYNFHSLNYQIEINKFDVIGFTLEYELNFSNVLYFLKLAKIPLRSNLRSDDDPIIIAGGSSCVNPEPIADFIDVFFIGDGEEIIYNICNILKYAKQNKLSRSDKIKELSKINGAYVPSYYKAYFNNENKQIDFKPSNNDVPTKIQMQVVRDLNNALHPVNQIVPNFETVFNRGIIEVARGCKNGCRFCQAGFIYRPYRERNIENLKEIVKQIFIKTGYSEFTISALSSNDYSKLNEIIDYILNLNQIENVCKNALFSVSLPSQRISKFSIELANKLSTNKKSGLTFALEAGSQKLRNIINKHLSENDLIETVSIAIDSGYKLVKLYFMIGLPYETTDDIIEIANNIIDVLKLAKQKKVHNFEINVTCSNFVPKPHTPFQWTKFALKDEIIEKQKILKDKLKSYREVSLKFTKYESSLLEAIFARGSRLLCNILEDAVLNGCSFDAWDKKLNFNTWQNAFLKNNIEINKSFNLEFNIDELLPWDFINTNIKKEFLKLEFQKAKEGKLTYPCNIKNCKLCGACC